MSVVLPTLIAFGGDRWGPAAGGAGSGGRWCCCCGSPSSPRWSGLWPAAPGPPSAPTWSGAREVLAERYARGDLTTDEYRERLEQLR